MTGRLARACDADLLGALRWWLVAALTGAVMFAVEASPAGASQVTVMYPVDGTLTSSPQESPPHHHFWGNFSVDDAAAAGSPVRARFANPSGTLSLSLGGSFEPCATAGAGGGGVIVNVFIDGQQIGRVYYAHLVNIPRTSGAIANGEQIGALYNGAQTSCWTGPHTHVEPLGFDSSACFVARGLNGPANGSLALGVIGGGYTSGDNKTCPPGAENGGGGSEPPPPPPDADQDGVPDSNDVCVSLAGLGAFLGCPTDLGESQPPPAVDFNGDGKADYCRLVGGANNQASYAQCTLGGSNSFGMTVTSTVLDYGFDTGRAWADFNGDGKADYCRRVGGANNQASYVQCTLSTGNAFGATITSPVVDFGFEFGRAWADFNGDGRGDYCRLVGGVNNQASYAQCTLSTGNAFGATVTSGVLDYGFEFGRAWVDFNGDGKGRLLPARRWRQQPGQLRAVHAQHRQRVRSDRHQRRS